MFWLLNWSLTKNSKNNHKIPYQKIGLEHKILVVHTDLNMLIFHNALAQ